VPVASLAVVAGLMNGVRFMHVRSIALFACVASLLFIQLGCGGVARQQPDAPPSDGGGSAGVGGSGGANGGAAGGAAGSAGAGGAGARDAGAADAFVPHDASPSPSSHALVPGGVRGASAGYVIVRTAGQSPGGNRVRGSTSYRMVGGLIGATQK
jgi:hypothetical protein